EDVDLSAEAELVGGGNVDAEARSDRRLGLAVAVAGKPDCAKQHLSEHRRLRAELTGNARAAREAEGAEILVAEVVPAHVSDDAHRGLTRRLDFLGDVRSETDAREIFRLEERDADANRRTLFLRRRGGNKTNKKKSSPEDRADHCPITHFFLRHLGIDKARE